MQILETEIEVKENESALPISNFRESIHFEDACFSYNEKPILKNLNLEIKKGQTIALVGKSGGGKTTLANLVARYYDLDEGTLYIDEKDIRDYKL